MSLERDVLGRGCYSSPFQEILDHVYVLSESREPLQNHEGREIKTSITLLYNHFSPEFQLKVKLMPESDNSDIGAEFGRLEISEPKSKKTKEPIEEEVCVRFLKGTLVNSFSNQNVDQHTENAPQLGRLDDLPAATKDIMSRMTTPIVLHFAGNNSKMLSINLALNNSEWAATIRKNVLLDNSVFVLVDLKHDTHNFKILTDYMSTGREPLEQFFLPGHEGVNKFDVKHFIANPIDGKLLGYVHSPVYSDLEQYSVVNLGGAACDREPEARKVRAYEASMKDLKLVKFESGQLVTDFLGFITRPVEDEYRLQPGDTFEVRFEKEPEPARGMIPWRATVVAYSKLYVKGMLAVQVCRGRRKETHEYMKFEPCAIDASGLDSGQIRDLLWKSKSERVQVKIDNWESAFAIIQAAHVSLHSPVPKAVYAFRSRVIGVLLGQRPDKFKYKDLYAHIRGKGFDPRKFMGLLNSRQADVVQASTCIRAGFLYIQGPPGTGKTHLLTEMVTPFLTRKQKTTVLVAGPTNNCADEIASGLWRKLSEKKKESPQLRGRYVLRVHCNTSGDQITRTQGSEPEVNSSPSEKSETRASAAKADFQNLSKLSEELDPKITSVSKGVNDQHVEGMETSVDHMKLLISGIISNEEYQYSTPTRFDKYRELFRKQAKGERLNATEDSYWTRTSQELFDLAMQGASAIISTTARISRPDILDMVKNQVVAVFTDESAFEREHNLIPLLAAHFSRDPCFVMIGDQDQLAPITKASLDENPFKPQIQMSFMGREIILCREYIMLTEQHRMVPEISAIANKLTYNDELTDSASTHLDNRPLAREFQSFAKRLWGYFDQPGPH